MIHGSTFTFFLYQDWELAVVDEVSDAFAALGRCATEYLVRVVKYKRTGWADGQALRFLAGRHRAIYDQTDRGRKSIDGDE